MSDVCSNILLACNPSIRAGSHARLTHTLEGIAINNNIEMSGYLSFLIQHKEALEVREN